MATKIHILEADIANKIAAGEVVQRPASAIKELIENALDAGAKKITIVVGDAGKTLMQVVDDGEGMSAEDAVLSFQRHATSKISAAQDLEAIVTLGFRGEALASIAAVSQVELKTRQPSHDLGTLIRIEGSELKEQAPVASEPGTSITVKNLFYNTPGRRNFLKTRNTELKNISDVVTRMAIAFPEIGWTYVSDDEQLLDLKPKDVEGRLADLFGERQFRSLVKLTEVSEFLTLDGFIGKPDFARKSRSEQFLFINRRYVINRALNHAVFQAYEHLMVKGAFPFYILNLTIDPRKIDVNVHPSKLEVKFENESAIYRFVLTSVRKTLGEHDLVPSVTFGGGQVPSGPDAHLRFLQNERMQTNMADLMPPQQSDTPDIDLGRVFRKVERRIGDDVLQRDGEATFPTDLGKSAAGAPDRIVQHKPIGTSAEQLSIQDGKPIWQVQNKYILSQIRTGLLIVDQHVAHERILYEKALSNFENNLPSTQQLLFPQTVQLTASDYSLAKELVPHLEKLGFDLKPFGKNTVVIEGIPADVRAGGEARILQDVLDEYRNNEHAQHTDARDNLAKSFACKAAIKAGDRLTTTEMLILIDQLFATQMPYVCPHGRPIVVKISIDELDRRFGRT
ncbi:MAG: DNA mismatch repair endonuclease MutL [Ignavibacteriales bacterium]|nr:DNA mismatch repair endonuclease MutL [Ignavibacteriales bacterium]